MSVVTSSPSGERPRRALPWRIVQQGSVVIILLAMMAGLALTTENFFAPSNLLNVATQSAIVIIVGLGMTFTMLTAGIDLSVGSVAALAGAVAAGLASQHGLPTAPAILGGLAIGVGFGLLNGLLIVAGKLPPFVATLATLAVGRGLTLVYTQGRPISNLPPDFRFWGTGQLGPLPMPIVVAVVIWLLSWWLLSATHFGLHTRAVGGDPRTARLAGIAVGRVTLLVYVLSGFFAAVAGIVLTARLWSAQPNAGVGLELDAIAAAVLGGTSLFGGTGGATGTVAGALIIGVLANGLNLLGISSYWQQVIKGVVFIAAVAVDLALKKHRPANATSTR